MHCKLLLSLMLVAGSVCSKPNIILFVTDDQDVVLDGMTPMQNVEQLISRNGVTFSNSYTASPICCPSRASLLTGRYPHNHGTYNNSLAGGCAGAVWRETEGETFAAILNDAGYETFYAGKYLNQYGSAGAGGPRVPRGWGDWHALVGNSVYYNYTLSHNGAPRRYRDEYLTDVIRDLALEFIGAQKPGAPFLMVVAPPAPHQPFTAAPRHRDAFANVTAKRTPNFNVAAKDKHWLMSMPPSPLPASALPRLNAAFRARWETLLAVDEMVAAVVGQLRESKLLKDTYLIYTSDNGYHIGQFSQVFDKRQPYETDIKVPLIIAGPKARKGVIDPTPTLNIDLAPTILRLAGLDIPASVDGRPIDLAAEGPEERFMLVEYRGERHEASVDASCPWKYDDNLAECYPQYECKCQDARNNTYACVRHLARNIDCKYCKFNDTQNFEEMYNLQSDPYEMENIVSGVFPSVRFWYQTRLQRLLRCRGATCDVGAKEDIKRSVDTVSVVQV